VYPQRLIYIGRRFETLYQVHLQRLECPCFLNLIRAIPVVNVYIVRQHVSTLTGSSSGRGIAQVLYKSKVKPFDLYNTSAIPRPEDVPVRVETCCLTILIQ
jgi:hypothetical protein